MGDLVWVMIFLPQTCGDIISFSPTYNGVRFFSRILSHERYFFPWYFLSRIFFPLKSSFKRFFFDAEITHIQSQMVGSERKATKVGSTATVSGTVLIISHITLRDCRVHIFSNNLSRNICRHNSNLGRGGGGRRCSCISGSKAFN